MPCSRSSFCTSSPLGTRSKIAHLILLCKCVLSDKRGLYHLSTRLHLLFSYAHLTKQPTLIRQAHTASFTVLQTDESPSPREHCTKQAIRHMLTESAGCFLHRIWGFWFQQNQDKAAASLSK